MEKSCQVTSAWFRKFSLVAALLLSFNVVLFAQTREVKGTVTSADDGMGIPGVTVLVKGTTVGTITDFDGNYTLSVPEEGEILQYSFVGLMAKEVAIAGQSVVNVVMESDTKQLDDVVVTALGIKREQKSLGYAVSKVSGEELTTVRQSNPVQSLSGKVSGVNISSSAGGVNSSSRIVIRGNGSIGGANQPLVVIDGIPMDNSSRDQAGQWGGYDYGDGLSDLNPDDIESMSILKGPNAAALYGSRAANGVILITTKTGQGSDKGIGITFNSNVTFDQVTRLPELQDVYGQGSHGELGKGADNIAAINNENSSSWGAKMEGQDVHNWDREGTLIKYAPQPNNVKDFYDTGVTMSNNISLTSHSDKNTVLLSMTDQRVWDVVPNSELKKQNFNLRGTSDLTDRLHVDGKVTYLHQKVKNRPALGDNRSNSAGTLLTMPRSIQLKDIQNYKYGESFGHNWGEKKYNYDGYPRIWNSENRWMTNPYWVMNEEYNEDVKDRFIGLFSATYDFSDHLKAMVRTGLDTYNTTRYAYRAEKNRLEPDGDMNQIKDKNSEWTSDFLITYNNRFGEDWSVNATVGGSYNYQFFERVGYYGRGFKTPEFYTIGNVKHLEARHGKREKANSSIYGTASFGYKSFAYLDMTARQDWSSSLPTENYSYFYPSITGSFIFTDAINWFKDHSDIFSFGKIRAGYAWVGNDADPYKLANTYEIYSWDVNGNPTANLKESLGLPTLKPERNQSFEIGLDMRMFNNRIGLDLTYYDSRTENQILMSEIPITSGFKYQMINAGEVRNSGIELMLRGTAIQTNDLTWDMAFTFAKNKNDVVELAKGVEAQVLGAARGMGVRVEARPGEPYGQIIGKGFLRDDKGNVVVDEKGMPKAGEEQVLGNFNPDWNGGFNTSLQYKNWNLGAVLDMKYGGELFAYSLYAMDAAGTSKNSLKGREAWYAFQKDPSRKGGYLVDGVTENGEKNGTYVNPETYYSELGSRNIAEPYVVDASYIKLSELSFGYSMPKVWFQNSTIKGVNLNFVARNLCYLWRATDNIYPDATYNNSNAQGIEHLALPETLGYGFNLKITL